jgi:tyrosine-protein kinase Etk/Wzc
MGQIQSIEELLSLILRRRWLIIIITVLGMIVSVVYAKMRPNSYETMAVIQIEAPSVSDGQANGGSAQMLQVIEQRLTTRENLSAMIERHNLFADQPDLSMEKKIGLLRTAVTFQAVERASDNGQSGGVSAILITARLGEAEQAARVANDFAQGILDQSTEGQRDRSDQNLAFFKDEADRVDQEINALEAEIANYKNAHADALPETSSARQDELGRISTEIRDSNQKIAALTSEATSIQQKQVQRETDKRRLSDISAALVVLNAQVADAQSRQTVVQAAMAAMPEVERVLSGYARQLQQLQDQYTALTQRMADAQTTQKLAERQQSERFTMLERAITPEYPVGGNRKKLAMVGSAASLAAALALAFLLDLVKPVVRTSAQMQRQLEIEPVVCIPEIRAPKGRLGSAALRLIDDPQRPIWGMPRFAVLAAIATVCLLLLAAAVG